MRMKQVFVLGAYGCGNRGDDAILQAICANLSDCTLTVTTGSKNDVSNEFPVKSTLCRLNEGVSAPILLQMMVNSLQMIRCIARADALVFGGGSLIHDITSYNLPFMFFWHAVATMFRKPVYYACIGIGPLKTKRGKKACTKWLSKAQGVFPRDRRGANLCSELGVPKFVPVCDVAFSYKKRATGGSALLRRFGLEAGNYVCLTASKWLKNENYWNNGSNTENELIIKRFTACATVIQQRLHKTLVFVPSEERDYELGQKLGDMIGSNYFCLPSTLRCVEVEAIVENSYLIFGMRMHPLIFALRQGIPVISIAYDEKVNELMYGMNLTDFVVNLDELQPELILHKLEQIELNRDAIIEKIEQSVAENYKRVQLCFETIRRDLGID